MHRVFRPLAVFGIASGVSVAAAFQSGLAGENPADYGASAFFPGYDLGKLELLEPTLYHVEESYVEPARVDWEAMYVAGLQSVERRVPVALFHREPGGEVLAVEIGDFRTVLDVPQVGSRKALQREMRTVARLLLEHLEDGDIPDVPEGIADPFAEIEYAMVNGMLRTLDPHSILLPPPDAKEMEVENQGEFGGLGITIIDRRGALTIDSTMPDTPAYRSGLQAEDRIVRVDGQSTVNMTLDEAVSLLRGPVGSAVEVSVERPSLPEPLQVTVVRQLIGLNRVEGELLDGGIGYVTIKAFHEHVERDLHDVLARLHREASPSGDLKGLVLDLRGNPGGFLNQAVRVSDTFLTDGDIVSTVDGSGRRTELERARRQAEPDYPMAILVDASSASASEIVAGALLNHDRAVIVGERSFGKGSVQNLHSFYDDSKLKLTISKYHTPGDKSIQSVGIPADVALYPSVVEKDADGEPVIRMFHRERVRREVDLDHSLAQVEALIDMPAYEVRYLRGPEQRQGVRPADDTQVQVARDVLLAAGRSWRRTDVLEAAGRVLVERRREGEREVVAAFDTLGLDWSDGPAATRGAALPLAVSLETGEPDSPRALLKAGEETTVSLVVTNTGTEPLYRVAAVTRDHGVLDGAEFFFGHLAPGETRRYTRSVSLVEGHASEKAPVTIELRDSGKGPLGTTDAELEIEGHALPQFAWQWQVRDASGDGIVQAGEKITVHLEIENIGGGSASSASARIRTRQRKVVEILDGTLLPGTPKEGCDTTAELECPIVLAAGASFSGDFVVQLADDWAGVIDLDLELREEAAYDHASIMRAGFYEFYGQDDRIRLLVGAPVPEAGWRRTPKISVTRGPTARTTDKRVALSGLVEDDGGIDHVLVFAGGDKVFLEGSGRHTPIRSLPFTADVELKAGENVLTVLATDVDGFSTTHSVVTWRDESELAVVTPAP